jgi:DNA-directed RNA polymerase subunit E"
MVEKACSSCHFITEENVCPKCKTSILSDDFTGLAIIFDLENSTIAKAMKIKDKGNYAIKVR